MPPDVRWIVRSRRGRRALARRSADQRARRAGLGFGFIFSAVLALAILLAALAYADLTRDLPPVETLPLLLNPPDGQLLQPTRLYDRTGQRLLLTLAPSESPRRYLPLNPQNPQHLPEVLAQATVVMTDPGFWDHPGYILSGWQNPDIHPTLAQRLVADLLLWNEPPSIRRALRERILAAQSTADYGRLQILEWYLNSADYGHYAFGADAAAQLYLGKSAAELNLAESALLAAISQAPALNPIDAPTAAYQRQQEVIQVMLALKNISADEAVQARATPLNFQSAPAPVLNPAPAFMELALDQLAERFARARLERGGLVIITTLDYDLQLQATCTVKTQLNRLAGEMGEVPAADGSSCEAARLLPTLSSGQSVTDVSASAMLIEPRSGQVLAVVGETAQGQESAFLTAHPSGSLLTPFIYLTGFTRGLSPASLAWDVPGLTDVQNPDGQYHGPVRLRLALANDYLVPAAQVLEQMGAENVWRTARSFGLSLDPAARLLQDDIALPLLDVARAYGTFAAQGVLAGQPLTDGTPRPVAVLKVEGVDHSIWLDWSIPQTQSVVTPQLAYLMTHILSDETARWPTLGHPNPLEIGRPASAKLGRTNSEQDVWAAGYTPQRAVVAWMGASEGSLSPKLVAGLWHALLQYASRDLPPESWTAPAGITVMDVCDPSGLLPTPACPNVVGEVFLNGNEPAHADTLYRLYQTNRETGRLATVFTPPQLIEERVYLVVPPEAKAWAEAAGLPVPPDSYDAIQPSSFSPDAGIISPAMFADVRGVVEIKGSAAGGDFAYYRVQVGQGLNPQAWMQVGEDVHTPVTDDVLVEWDTRGLSGLYAVRMMVVRADQRVEMATIQVTVDNEPPQVSVLFPQEGQELDFASNRQVTFRAQASDNLALVNVEFYVDDRLIGTLIEPPFALTWAATPGKHTLRVVAVDRAGNQSEQTVKFILKP